jgi:hypothetical protein
MLTYAGAAEAEELVSRIHQLQLRLDHEAQASIQQRLNRASIKP